KGADDAIEGAVLEGEPFAAEYPPVNLDPRLLDPPACPAVHPVVRIDGRDLADVRRVARQVQAGAEADLQNVTAGVVQQFPAMPGHERSVQPEIAEQRDDHPRIEAHSRLLIRPPSTSKALDPYSVEPGVVDSPGELANDPVPAGRMARELPHA